MVRLKCSNLKNEITHAEVTKILESLGMHGVTRADIAKLIDNWSLQLRVSRLLIEYDPATFVPEWDELMPEQRERLDLPIEGLPISVRAYNSLNKAGIRHVWQLVSRTEADLLKVGGFGRESLRNVKEIIRDLKLHLGMNLPIVPP